MPKKVVFDQFHSPLVKIHDTSTEGMTTFIAELQKADFEINTITTMISEATLEQHDVLIIPFPIRDFQASELIAIRNFVDNSGKGLLLLGNFGNVYNCATLLNGIAQSYGITFQNDRVTDPDQAFKREIKFMGEVFDYEKVVYHVKITNFASHPITTNIKTIGHFSGCSLELKPPAEPLAWSSSTSFADRDMDKKFDVIEKKGELITSAVVSSGKGRLVAIGDTALFTNIQIDYVDNKRFCVNVIRWLANII